MNSSTGLRIILIATILAGALYGASYQQYRYFNPKEIGLSDSNSYLPMAAGKYESASIYHVYRFTTPLLAGWIAPLLPIQSTGNYEQEVLAFYIVNFVFNWLASYILFFVLKQYRMSDLLALVGGLLYIASRVTVMSTAPIVDAAVFAALIALVWLINRDRPLELALCLPILALTKETMLLLMFLPLFTKQRRRPVVWIGIVVAVGFFFVARQLWSIYIGLENRSLAGDITSFLQDTILKHIRYFFTLSGIHDFACGFTFLIPWAIYGYYLNKRNRIYTIPSYIHLFLPIGLAYAILNGNLGRLFQTAFPVVIPYALISIQVILEPSEKAVSNGVESAA
jgi:hypothetical protein